jgi:hypothetical protein
VGINCKEMNDDRGMGVVYNYPSASINNLILWECSIIGPKILCVIKGADYIVILLA